MALRACGEVPASQSIGIHTSTLNTTKFKAASMVASLYKPPMLAKILIANALSPTIVAF